MAEVRRRPAFTIDINLHEFRCIESALDYFQRALYTDKGDTPPEDAISSVLRRMFAEEHDRMRERADA